MAETPNAEPTAVTAGDTVRWRKSLPDYLPTNGWALHYRLINAAGRIDIAAAADGDAHLVDVAPAVSAAWGHGDYTWIAYVTDGTDRVTIASGTIRIHPDLAAQADGFDTRSHARRMLDAIRAVLEKRATATHLSYQHDGRQLQYIPHAELLALATHYERAVATEEARDRASKGLPGRNRIAVRF